MEECDYGFMQDDFFAVYFFFETFAYDGDVSIDQYVNRLLDECFRHGLNDELNKRLLIGSDSIKKKSIGKMMSDIKEKMGLHVKACDRCKREYNLFIKRQIDDNLEDVYFFKQIGTKATEELLTYPDFLSLHSY
ncbi:hypothetical protein ACFLQO_01455 [Candidatus Aenigmatarchaeota archaeon]